METVKQCDERKLEQLNRLKQHLANPEFAFQEEAIVAAGTLAEFAQGAQCERSILLRVILQ